MDGDVVEISRQHFCNVIPLNYSLTPEDIPDPSGEPYFTMTVIINKLYYELPHMNLDENKTTNVTIPIHKIFKHRMRPATETMLTVFEISEPHHNSMTTKILDATDQMLNNTHKNDKILNVVVHISVYIYYYRSDNYNQAIAWLEEYLSNYNNGLVPANNNNRLVPASDSSIEALERVELERAQGCHCVICLGDFEVNREIIRMPCSHFFHANCIIQWLHRQNECPLCRFRLPTTEH